MEGLTKEQRERANRIRQHRKNLVHFARAQDVEQLEKQFAQYTPAGWVLPEWLVVMASSVRRH